MMKTIKWGIIGCGNVTEQKSGPAFNKINDSQLVAVMRRDGQKAEDYAKRHNIVSWYDDADALINDPAVNAVYVATPPDTHALYAIKSMKAGKPVYVEKPMATTYKECLAMIDVSKETGTPLFIAYYRRMLPGFVKVKQLLESGRIGKPVYFQIRYFSPAQEADFQQPLPWRVIPKISGGGYLYDLASHQLDVIDFLLGPIKNVTALTHNQKKLYEPEDFVVAGFVGQDNLTGSGVWNFVAPEHSSEDTISIVGEKGTIIFSCFGFAPTQLILDGETTLIDNPRPEHVQLPLIETIVAELTGKGECPSKGESGARTSKVLEEITQKTNSK
jgi:predicted dehydrogenase